MHSKIHVVVKVMYTLLCQVKINLKMKRKKVLQSMFISEILQTKQQQKEMSQLFDTISDS